MNCCLLIILCFTAISGEITYHDYCKYNKNNPPCKTKCKWSSACGKYYNHSKWTDTEINFILDMINGIRGRPNLQKYGIDLAPKNLHILTYDKEAEFLAQCHNKRCLLNVDTVRLNHKGKRYGYTFYTMAQEESIVKVFGNTWIFNILAQALDTWTLEKPRKGINFYDIISDYQLYSGMHNWCQFYWANSRKIGCSVVAHFYNEIYVYSLLCYYYPAGNIIGEPTFLLGNASLCPGKFDGRFCKDSNVEEDTFVPPAELSFCFRYKSNGSFIIISLILLYSL